MKSCTSFISNMLVVATLSVAQSSVAASLSDGVKLDCPNTGSWRFKVSTCTVEPGVEVVRVKMKSEKEAPPPRFSLKWFVPQNGVHHLWTSESMRYSVPLPWTGRSVSELASWMPLYAFFDTNDRNRFAVACSESRRRVVFKAPCSETGMGFNCAFEFFTVPEAPLTDYEVEMRLDSRDVFYGKAIGDASEWICSAAGIEPMTPPDAAFDAVYSTWYDFHQDVSADGVERECAIAAKLGMKTVIVDDGWQIDLPLGNRPWNGYRYCGDWKPGRNFPDMAEHVKRVHAMGLKYLLWYSVPFVGEKCANYERFKGKYLPVEHVGGHVVDPRFPEVREFVIKTYEDAVKKWDIDGFKLDFIDRFTLKGGVADPAVAENYEGRDIKSIPIAVDVMLSEAMRRLKAIKPDILIEFRQAYVGPSIRRFGNMLRATDCPLAMVENRNHIARIRLAAGNTAVHSDMLEWRADDMPENAALFILNSIFGVVQYSMHLGALGEDHIRMTTHWIRFANAHRAALLKGEFRPRHPECDFPIIEGESAGERVIAIYKEGLVVDAGAPDKPVYILNAANSRDVVVDLKADTAKVESYDTFGAIVATFSCKAGLQSILVPISGYLKIFWNK